MRILNTRGDTSFWQWDTGRKIIILGDDEICDEAHFCTGSGDPFPATIRTEDGLRMIDVPDEILQTAKPFTVYIRRREGNGELTRHFQRFNVFPMTKPAGYAYTPSERQTWAELDKRIKDLEDGGVGGVTDEQVANAVKSYMAEHPIDPGADEQEIRDIVDEYLAENPPAAGPNSGENAALTSDQIDLLENAFAHTQWADEAGPQYAAQLIASLRGGESGGTEPEPETPTKTLVSISAEYTGGNVPVGTAVSSLSGVTVTAHYSDGSTAAVTGYTLSGTIAEGENIVTVTYMGKTATITVTGEAQAPEGRKLLHNWVLSDAEGSGTDTVGGATMAPHYAEQGEDGWTIDEGWKAIRTPAILGRNRTVEFDIKTAANEETLLPDNNNPLFIFTDAANDWMGHLWVSFTKDAWMWVNISDWTTTPIGLDDADAFDGRTVAFCVGEDGYITLWVDGEYISTSPIAAINSVSMNLSKSAGGYAVFTLSACRVYEGVL